MSVISSQKKSTMSEKPAKSGSIFVIDNSEDNHQEEEE
jgi:hypothetical protein